jgi:glutamine---fructose-6-phosphate transaminase (isomerizing)
VSGIVGVAAHRNVSDIMFEGLRRCDDGYARWCGLSITDRQGRAQHLQQKGDLRHLVRSFDCGPFFGRTAIGFLAESPNQATCVECHWDEAATAVIIGNMSAPSSSRLRLECLGHTFRSNSSAELTCALLGHYCKRHESVKTAIDAMLAELSGKFALIVLHEREPGTLYCLHHGEPLAIGIGIGEHGVSARAESLLQITDRFVWLEEDDTARVRADAFQVWDGSGEEVKRDIVNYVPSLGRSNSNGSHSPCL